MTVSFAQDTVTVVRAQRLTDSRNDVYLNWEVTTTHTVARCRFQPGGGERLHESRDGAVIDASLFAPLGADIDYRDRVVFSGTTYHIEGPVNTWRSATGALAHLEIALRRVEG